MNTQDRPVCPTGVVPSRLTSDQPTLLQPWTPAEEAECREAEQRLASLQARRAIAAQSSVDKLRSLVGLNEDAAQRMLRHADAVRDILKPFDSGVRVASKGEW